MTGQIIDFQQYRADRQAREAAAAIQMPVPSIMMIPAIYWVPVWVMAPTMLTPANVTTTHAGPVA